MITRYVKLVLFTFVLWISARKDAVESILVPDNIAYINNTVYAKRLLATVENTPYKMSVSAQTGDVYFIMNERYRPKAYVLKKDATRAQRIRQLSNAQCTAYDRNSKLVYFGTDKGLRSYDESTGLVSDAGFERHDVWEMSHSSRSDDIYFLDYSDDKFYKISSKRDSAVPVSIPNDEPVKSAIVDSFGNIFYETTSNKVRAKFATGAEIDYENIRDVIFAIDGQDNVFAAKTSDDNSKNDLCTLGADKNVKLIARFNFLVSSIVLDEFNSLFVATTDGDINRFAPKIKLE